jgi:hypothetical protein
MPKGWAAWPRSARWAAAGIAAVTLALVVTWVLFVPAADWLAHHDVGSATGMAHETALDNARGRLLTLGAGLFAAGALLFTARNFTLSREGQVTDRYTKAIEQLGSDKLDVRIGGIYALERVARDSARDHPIVMEVLTAFIRERSLDERPPQVISKTVSAQITTTLVVPPSTRPDVQAAVTVIGRRDAKRDIRLIDLTDANLTGANLTGADLSSALLIRTQLLDADLTGARLVGAVLYSANLRAARLDRAVLFGVTAYRADFRGADLRNAHLLGAYLSDADLAGARWPKGEAIPDGWKLDTHSGLLERAATGSGPTDTN